MPQKILKKMPDFPFELNAKSVAQWLQSLPLIDNKNTCQLVYAILRQLNLTALPYRQRLEILEEFRPYVDLLANNLEKHFLDVAFPLEKKRRKLAKLSTQFHREMATAYITILGDGGHNRSDISAAELGALIGHALHALYQSLVHIMLIYEPPSSRFWKKVYFLYRLAENLKIQETVYENKGDEKKYTINVLFKRILLLWIANPYRQKQCDIQQIYSVLEQFADRALLSAGRPAEALDSICAIDLSGSLPPMHINSRMNELNDGNLRFLDPKLVGLELLEQSARKKAGTPLQTPRGLLMRLIKNLGIPEDRLHSREAEMETTEIILGLPTIIKLCQNADKTPRHLNGGGTINWINDPNLDILPLEEGQYLSPESSRNRSEGQISTELYAFRRKITPEQIWDNPSLTDKPVKNEDISHPCNIGDSSVKGYRIVSTSNENLNVTVGEIAGLKRNQEIIEIGVVRWIQCFEESRVEFGLELLARSITPAEAWFTGNPPKKRDVLFLSQSPDSEQPVSVLIPAIRLRADTPIKLKFSEKIVHFKLLRLLEMTPDFVHYSLLEYDKS